MRDELMSLLANIVAADRRRWPLAASARAAVAEPTLLFALLWRLRIVRHAHAASHGPLDTAGEHDTQLRLSCDLTVVRSQVRVAFANTHAIIVLVVRVENHEHEQKARTQNDHQSSTGGSQSAALRLRDLSEVPISKFADLGKLSVCYIRPFSAE